MELVHTFTIPATVAQAWEVLRDVERIAPCMPGATLDEVTDDEFRGQVKVKVGPITITYRGSARFTSLDPDAHAATIAASGKETRGSGTARATVRAELIGRGDRTDVRMTTDLAVTGRPAQFGRGVMADVGAKLVQQFADCLSEELAAPPPAAEPAAEAGALPPAPPTAVEPAPSRPRAEAIDLVQVAGGPVARRAAPVVVAALVVVLVWWLLRRRR
jgi:uncharacterized protein